MNDLRFNPKEAQKGCTRCITKAQVLDWLEEMELSPALAWFMYLSVLASTGRFMSMLYKEFGFDDDEIGESRVKATL